jgi:hypothetical protein
MMSRRFSVLALFLAAGCGSNPFIEKITVSPSETLEALKVTLVFRRSVRTELQGVFPFRDYGYVFLNPFTETKPFEIGFLLNASALDEGRFPSVEPTLFLPNGMPHPVGYPLLSLGESDPEDGPVDVYAYVDALRGRWAGAVAVFMFIGEGNFPDSLLISEGFLEDGSRVPRAHAMLFGPVLDDRGKVKAHGGIGIFANLKALMPKSRSTQGALTLRSRGKRVLQGKNAEYYGAHPERISAYEGRLLQSLETAGATRIRR